MPRVRRGAGRGRRGAAGVRRRRSSRRGGRSPCGRAASPSAVAVAPASCGRSSGRDRGRRGAGRGRRGAAAIVVAGGPRSSRGGGGGQRCAAAASRFGAAPPSAERGAATIRAGSAPIPRTPRLPGVRISKSRSESSTPNSSRADRRASSTLLPLNSLYALIVVSLGGSGGRVLGGEWSCWQPRPGSAPVRRGRTWAAVSTGRPVAATRLGTVVCGPGRSRDSSRGTGTSRPSR